jgi:hypothetical protein
MSTIFVKVLLTPAIHPKAKAFGFLAGFTVTESGIVNFPSTISSFFNSY